MASMSGFIFYSDVQMWFERVKLDQKLEVQFLQMVISTKEKGLMYFYFVVSQITKILRCWKMLLNLGQNSWNRHEKNDSSFFIEMLIL